MKDIEELKMLMKEAKEFYILEDITNYESYGKYLFGKVYKEIGYNNDYLRNYTDDRKIFIEDDNKKSIKQLLM